MYVRTNLARERLVVTEEQADEIDKEWHYHTLKDYFTQEELENETTRLAKQFGKSPNISDVLR
ncbi:MAG: hypothetical protein EKK61_04220 [Rickettsiales bacterium]|nr:MAG: hypothetical protein EKK61_04220 [Rickettsiales bacterium]